MSRTAIQPSKGVYSGSAVPTITPSSPDAIYYQISPAGALLGEFFWDSTNSVWVMKPESVASANWTAVPEFGWVGAHNSTDHYGEPAYTTLADAGTAILFFGVDAMSTQPLQFTIVDKLTAETVAVGTFPTGVRRATAEQCNLVDELGDPVTSFSIASGSVVQLAAVPTNGYASAPADGYGFSVEGRMVYGS
jgi:hypothetical protein